MCEREGARERGINIITITTRIFKTSSDMLEETFSSNTEVPREKNAVISQGNNGPKNVV